MEFEPVDRSNEPRLKVVFTQGEVNRIHEALKTTAWNAQTCPDLSRLYTELGRNRDNDKHQ